jgi:hypothetical protein
MILHIMCIADHDYGVGNQWGCRTISQLSVLYAWLGNASKRHFINFQKNEDNTTMSEILKIIISDQYVRYFNFILTNLN